MSALFRPWEKAKGIVIAVSGGPDSMALLYLATNWARSLPRPPGLSCLTFDHALRPESAEEAELVRRACASLGVTHLVRRWDGPKPATGLQEAAREARYGALFEAARDEGADTIFVGHHADDQAETILFRLSRGSGLEGLSGMRPNALTREGLNIGRPLLSLPKQRLVAICREARLAYVCDPSNNDPKYGRTRMRLALQALRDLGVDAPDWPRLARRLARANDALDAGASEALARCQLPPSGDALIALDFDKLGAYPPEIILRCVRRAVEGIREKPGSPSPARLERLESLVERLVEAWTKKEKAAATLAGLKFTLDRRGVLEILEAPPRRFG